MSEKRFTVIFVDGDYLAMPYFFDDGEEISDYDVVELLNELSDENEKLKLKIVSLENEIQRQNNEIKNIRKEFTKKTEELNWLKSEDYLKKIY